MVFGLKIKGGRGDSNPQLEIHKPLQNKGFTENTKNDLDAPLSDARTEAPENTPELAALIDRWDALPDAIRKAILALAEIDIEKSTEKQ